MSATSANSAAAPSFRHQLVLADSIGIVGTGAVAQALGRALHAGGAPVTAVSGRSVEKAGHVAGSIAPAVQAVPLSDLPALTDHIIIATSDEAIHEVARLLAAA